MNVFWLRYPTYTGNSVKEGKTSVVGDPYILAFNQNEANLDVTPADVSNAR